MAGGIALTPAAAFHDILVGNGSLVRNGVAQWEFDTDMGSLEGALFAIVYRYCIRQDKNDMLNQGVIGAFVLTRTLSRIQVPSYCSSIPLDCKFICVHGNDVWCVVVCVMLLVVCVRVFIYGLRFSLLTILHMPLSLLLVRGRIDLWGREIESSSMLRFRLDFIRCRW